MPVFQQFLIRVKFDISVLNSSGFTHCWHQHICRLHSKSFLWGRYFASTRWLQQWTNVKSKLDSFNAAFYWWKKSNWRYPCPSDNLLACFVCHFSSLLQSTRKSSFWNSQSSKKRMSCPRKWSVRLNPYLTWKWIE